MSHRVRLRRPRLFGYFWSSVSPCCCLILTSNFHHQTTKSSHHCKIKNLTNKFCSVAALWLGLLLLFTFPSFSVWSWGARLVEEATTSHESFHGLGLTHSLLGWPELGIRCQMAAHPRRWASLYVLCYGPWRTFAKWNCDHWHHVREQ